MVQKYFNTCSNLIFCLQVRCLLMCTVPLITPINTIIIIIDFEWQKVHIHLFICFLWHHQILFLHDEYFMFLTCHHAQCVLRRVSIILSTLTGVDTITETPLWTLRSTAAWRSPVLLVDSTSEQEVNRSHDHRMCFIPHRLQCLSLFLPVSVNKAWIQTSL